MSKQESIKRMEALAARLNAIVAEMTARKEFMLQDMHRKAA
ncbi:hypothetical protein ACXKU5_002530 [Yersinia enterocolitica]|nr:MULTISPECIES: hypothetical protein [Yersinia]CQJ08206.1 Uncharacterised protein [Yersinia enterocolitica]CRY82955.1 Uncharacterised protein [Yersinia intermedia]